MGQSPEEQVGEIHKKEDADWEEEYPLSADLDRESEQWKNWLFDNSLREMDEWDEFGQQRGETDKDYAARMADLGPEDQWERMREQSEANWRRIAEMAEAFEALDGSAGSFSDFAEKHGLPGGLSRGDVERLIARERKWRSRRERDERDMGGIDPRYGHRGPEPKNKHQKGGETLRANDNDLREAA